MPSGPVLPCRRATLADSDTIWRWRNDPQTIAMSLSKNGVLRADHDVWYQRVLNSSAVCALYMLQHEGSDCAVVRFDLDDPDQARVSINLAPEKRGQGIAGPVLRCAMDQFCQDYPEIRCLSAEVLAQNPASLKIFEATGFQRITQEDGVHRLQLTCL